MINFPGWQLIPIALALVGVSLVFLREEHFWFARLLAVIALVLLLVPTALWLWGESWSPATAWLGVLWLVADFTIGVAALLAISSKEATRNEKQANRVALTRFMAEGQELFQQGNSMPAPTFPAGPHQWHLDVYDWKGRTEKFIGGAISEAARLKFVDLSQRPWQHLTSDVQHNLDLLDFRQWLQNLQAIIDALN